jgi:hypothetical protein
MSITKVGRMRNLDYLRGVIRKSHMFRGASPTTTSATRVALVVRPVAQAHCKIISFSAIDCEQRGGEVENCK